jgi:hypothetical protein
MSMDSSLHHARALARRIVLSGAAVGVGLVMLARPAAASTPVPVPVPTFTCAAANGDGTFTYFFGYTLAGAVPENVPIGPNNQFVGSSNQEGDKSLGQPTTFSPGSHPNAFSVTTATTNLQWHLSGTHLKAESSELCTNVPVVSEAPAALVLPLAAAGPFGVWFAAMRRRARRARRADARPATA